MWVVDFKGPFPSKLPKPEHPACFGRRYVSAIGRIRWNHHFINVSQICIGEHVGLEEIDNGLWNICFGPLKLGRLLEEPMRIRDQVGRLKRHQR